jgi:hypothetical protein
MKIFLQDASILTVRIDETNPDIIMNTRKITEIYSLSGIYECENEKIRKKEISDIPSELITFKGRRLIIDKSIIKYNNFISNIDATHFISSFERCECTLRRNARITLVVEKINAKIKQIYFETNEDIQNYSIAEDFSTLLSAVS